MSTRPRIRCAIYTRKSSEEGLEQSFNSLHAQREACEAYIKSQKHEGWTVLKDTYDDGGFSGANIDRPALTQLIKDIQNHHIDIVIVYKVDRLSRSLADFVKLVDLFDQHKVSFVSVTQQFNTSTSMGRLTLNVLLSFAQFEREVTGERIRDKITASKQKGMWMGGTIPLGYDVKDKQLVINQAEARIVQYLFNTYIKVRCVRSVKEQVERLGYRGKQGKSFSRGALYTILKNPIYAGKVQHRGKCHEGLHESILEDTTWKQVQNILHYNRHAHKQRVHVKQPSLLAGILFDDHGHPMSPTHTNKKNRRYRYYVSQAMLQYRSSEGGSVLRVAAGDIEKPVIQELKNILQSPQRLNPLFEHSVKDALTQVEFLEKADKFSSDWNTLSPSRQIEYIQKIIDQVIVGRTQLSIQLNLAGLGQCLGLNILNETSHTIEIPIQLRRCGLEMKVIIPCKEDQAVDPASLEAIQQGLAQALLWNEQLLKGEVASIQDIASRGRLDRSYVARRLRLAFLSPDIMVSILEGHIPPDLTLHKLRKGFPLDWNQQRKRLGFDETSAPNVTR